MSQETKIQAVPVQDINDFIKDTPELCYSLLGQTHLEHEETMKRLGRLTSGNTQDLILYQILHEVQRRGIRSESGLLHIKISEKELGSRTGLARETISREIKKLSERNVIDTKRGQIIINNVVDLESKVIKFS